MREHARDEVWSHPGDTAHVHVDRDPERGELAGVVECPYEAMVAILTGLGYVKEDA